MFLKEIKNICLIFVQLEKTCVLPRGGVKCARVRNIGNRVPIWACDNFIEDEEAKRYMSAFGFFWCIKEQGVRDYACNIFKEAPRERIHSFPLTPIPLLGR